MDTDQKQSYLKDEYLKLQDMYEAYDSRSLTIKGWLSAAAIAGMALGFDGDKNPHGIIWILIAAISACIWYLEGRWKLFQYGLRDRIRVIEAYFRNDPDVLLKDPLPFQTYHWWFQSHRHDTPIFEYEKNIRPRPFGRRLFWAMAQDFVFVPYLPIIIICVILWKPY
jgi:hypothetical protein